MSSVITYNETQFSDISNYGDNTDRIQDIMMSPTLGQTALVRYQPAASTTAKVNCITVNCDYGALLLSGAYTIAQNGAVISLLFDSVVRLEHKFNWTGLSGYIGGADDYNAENEIMLTCYDSEIAASTQIDVSSTGGTNVRKMLYATVYGVLSDGTIVEEAVKGPADGTGTTTFTIYTVPAGKTFYMSQLVVSVRHIDLYSGKGYIMYNGLPVMVFDIMQTEIGGVNGLVFPFWEMDVKEGQTLAIRMDNFECGYEYVTTSIYSNETVASGGSGGGNRIFIRRRF